LATSTATRRSRRSTLLDPRLARDHKYEASADPLAQRIYEAGDQVVEMNVQELLAFNRAYAKGLRAAILRLAEELDRRIPG
jgi:hypothetical protein